MRREALKALRERVAIHRSPQAIVRVTGEQAYDWVDAVSPRPLFVRDGQVLHTVFLTDRGTPFADVYIAVDDLDYLILAEGVDGPSLIAWLESYGADLDAELIDESTSHRVVSAHGPYAWELVARLLTPDVLGIPYLCFFDAPDWGLCLRAGKTGEFGYDFVVPADREQALCDRLLELASDMDPVEVTADELDHCALENGFFSVRHPGVLNLDPRALQLQWRIDPRRKAPGLEALAARPNTHRICWVTGARIAEPCDLGGDAEGRLLFSRWSPLQERAIGLALVERERAHPGLTLRGPDSEWFTHSSPLVTNRSLFIDTQRHSWASRATDVFPELP